MRIADPKEPNPPKSHLIARLKVNDQMQIAVDRRSLVSAKGSFFNFYHCIVIDASFYCHPFVCESLAYYFVDDYK